MRDTGSNRGEAPLLVDGSGKPLEIDRYRVIEELGRGGMAAVYRALDAVSSEAVALKLLTESGAAARTLFEREYSTLAKLSHPRVIRVFDFGATRENQLYYTMELVEGEDLLSLRTQSWRRICEILRDVCTSLALLHAHKMLHRDVNPRNVRVEDGGHAKLLDFGALAPFGLADELVGTPGCMAPENLLREPLDGRSDLFSLGVVAYWLIARRLPYPMLDSASLAEARTKRPAPPSLYRPDVPRGLDELILAMLHFDPLARPANAAEVIDRLGALAALDDELLAGIAESHVGSATWVGRDKEREVLLRAIRNAKASRGTMLAITGERGAGKTRLLRELTIASKLELLATINLRAADETAPGGLVGALADALHAYLPSEARSYVAMNGLPSPMPSATGSSASRSPSSEVANDVVYQHASLTRFHAAVVAAVRDVAVCKPLLLTIDDADELTSDSASLLPMLAQAAVDCSLLVAITRGHVGSTPGTEQATLQSVRIELPRLGRQSVEELLYEAFGEVPHRTRLAHWLLLASHGNPGQLHGALLGLIERRAIRYAGGAWALPADLADQRLPTVAKLDPAFLDALPQDALEVLALLATYEAPLSARMVDIFNSARLGTSFAVASERLLCDGLLVKGAQGELLVAQPELSRRALDRLSPARREALHVVLADIIAAAHPASFAALRSGNASECEADEVVMAMRAALHGLLAGQDTLSLLHTGAVELTVRGEKLAEAAPTIERALAALKHTGRARENFAGLLAALTLAGTYVDWRLSYRYGDEALELLCDQSGLTLAARLHAWLGGRVGLYAGLLLAAFRFLLFKRHRVTKSFREIMLGVIGLGTALLGVTSVLQDSQRAQALLRRLTPLRFLPRGHPAREVHEYQCALVEQAEGDYASARRRASAFIEYLHGKRARDAFPELSRQQLVGGVSILLGQLDACRTDGSVEHSIKVLSQLRTSTARQTLAATRAAIHAHRGELAPYVKWHNLMDRIAADEGSTWRNDVSIPRWLWSSHSLWDDVITLKRDLEQIRTLASQAPTVARLHDIIHASYLCARGSSAESLERYRSLLESAHAERGLRAAQQLGLYARILRRAGRLKEAVRTCELSLERLRADELEYPVLTFMLESELPLALAAAGELTKARQLVDKLVRDQARGDNELLKGLARGASAEVALHEDDLPQFSSQLEAMRKHFAPTNNPALLAQCQRLDERMAAKLLPNRAVGAESTDDTFDPTTA